MLTSIHVRVDAFDVIKRYNRHLGSYIEGKERIEEWKVQKAIKKHTKKEERPEKRERK